MGSSLLAITIGDVAGIGPEVIVRALDSAEFPRGAVPLVIGSVPVLQRAAALTHSALIFRRIEVAENGAGLREQVSGVLSAGAIPVCDPCDAGASEAPAGVISAAAGEAAYRCLIRAVELARSGAVDATSSSSGAASSSARSMTWSRVPRYVPRTQAPPLPQATSVSFTPMPRSVDDRPSRGLVGQRPGKGR